MNRDPVRYTRRGKMRTQKYSICVDEVKYFWDDTNSSLVAKTLTYNRVKRCEVFFEASKAAKWAGTVSIQGFHCKWKLIFLAAFA